MLNPFTIGIAQGMSGLSLFSGIEYRVFCWVILMSIAVAFVLWYASRIRKPVEVRVSDDASLHDAADGAGKIRAWICYGLVTAVLVVFAVLYAGDCVIRLGESSFETPWLLWMAVLLFAVISLFSLKNSVRMYILTMLLFAIVFLVIGALGYGWYLSEICALFMALAVCAGFSAGYSADKIASEFVAGAKDMFPAALIIGFAAGIIVILENGQVIDRMLASMAAALGGSGRIGALGSMYGIQTLINLFIPSASAKAAVTMPIMAPLFFLN